MEALVRDDREAGLRKYLSDGLHLTGEGYKVSHSIHFNKHAELLHRSLLRKCWKRSRKTSLNYKQMFWQGIFQTGGEFEDHETGVLR